MSKKIKICALCGDTDVIGTRDHIPPKGIFIKPRPQNLITVPACIKCNNNGSKDDEIFKTFLAFILGLSPTTDSLFKSALSTASKKFSRYILANMQHAYLTTPSGIIYDQGYTIPLKPEITLPFEAVIKRITSGLYYYHFNNYIGNNTAFQIRFHNILKKEMINEVNFAVNKIGSGHFSYGYARAIESTKCISLWLFEFYERYWISCSTLFDSAQQSKDANDHRLAIIA